MAVHANIFAILGALERGLVAWIAGGSIRSCLHNGL